MEHLHVRFLVVYQTGADFVAAHRPDEIRGVSPDAIWFFGEPKNSIEAGLKAAAMAAAHATGITIHQVGASRVDPIQPNKGGEIWGVDDY
jgi:hypothetical protein